MKSMVGGSDAWPIPSAIIGRSASRFPELRSLSGRVRRVPEAANTVSTEFVHLDETFVNSDTCAFDLTLHLFGTYRNADYFDNIGFLHKTLVTAGGGALTVTATANGTTLTRQNQSFLLTIYYNADGSVSNSHIQRA
jgi:hypothetical protein